nr:DNA polymerase I (TIGR00593) [uncultured Mediterranean phage uvMED]
MRQPPKQVYVDIETDGLLDEVTKVHCLVYSCDGEVTVVTGDDIRDSLSFLKDQHLIGHNLLGFDFRVLDKLYGFCPTSYTDTLILSRLTFPDLRAKDFDARAMDSKMYGSHALKAWGHRLSFFKGDYGEQEGAWDHLSDEMIEYCKRDVSLTEKLHGHLTSHHKHYSPDSLELEHSVSKICYEQENFGFPFNVPKALELYKELTDRNVQLNKDLVEAFGSWVVDEGERKKGLYHKIKIVEFNPNSRQHIAKRLKDIHGWKPKEFTPSGEPKIDEKVLGKLKYPEAELMSEYLMISKRLGQLAEGNEAWLKLEKDGRLHGSVNCMGSVTSRCSHTHPNLAQVPSTKAPFGKQCRELFTTDPGFSLLGVDVSGLELRCLAHYMARYDDGAYGKILLEGDIHTANQEAAGLATRDQAKTYVYGFLYGAGDQKIGQIIGKGATEGKRLKEKFLKKIPALRKLREQVQDKANKHGFVRGLDGRRVPVRSAHAALNTLLQSAGAIICKRWVVLLHDMLEAEGYSYGHDYAQVAFVHDEVQLMVKDEHVDSIGRIAVHAIELSGEYYGFRIPLTGEYRGGRNWADTH